MPARARYLLSIVGVLGVLTVGCKEDKTTPTPRPAVPSAPQKAPEESEPKPADSTWDDVAAPQWLPTPEEIVGWVRTSRVQVLYSGEWDKLESQRLQMGLDAFGIKSVSLCDYEATHPNTSDAVAHVIIAEAQHSDDAFGLFTAMMPEIPNQRVGSRSAFARHPDRHEGHCWQGMYYFQVAATSKSGSDIGNVAEKLLAGLVKPVPTEELPEVVTHLPAERRMPGHLWLARKHLKLLPDPIQEEVLRGHALEASQALGLDADSLFVLAAYDPGEDETPNYVWLVKYATPQEVDQAYARYKNIARKIKPAPVLLMDYPKNERGKASTPYLAGTWTPEQESTMHVLLEIKKNIENE